MDTDPLPIKDVIQRLFALNDRWLRLTQVMLERAADEAMQLAPGGKTGLLTRTLRQLGEGRSAQIVEEFTIDVGMLKELRALEAQAAKELGQWPAQIENEQNDITRVEYKWIEP